MTTLVAAAMPGPRRNFAKMFSIRTRSSAVAERPRDASCLSVVSFKFQHAYSAVFLLPVTAASDLLVHKILLWLGYLWRMVRVVRKPRNIVRIIYRKRRGNWLT